MKFVVIYDQKNLEAKIAAKFVKHYLCKISNQGISEDDVVILTLIEASIYTLEEDTIVYTIGGDIDDFPMYDEINRYDNDECEIHIKKVISIFDTKTFEYNGEYIFALQTTKGPIQVRQYMQNRFKTGIGILLQTYYYFVIGGADTIYGRNITNLRLPDLANIGVLTPAMKYINDYNRSIIEVVDSNIEIMEFRYGLEYFCDEERWTEYNLAMLHLDFIDKPEVFKHVNDILDKGKIIYEYKKTQRAYEVMKKSFSVTFDIPENNLNLADAKKIIEGVSCCAIVTDLGGSFYYPEIFESVKDKYEVGLILDVLVNGEVCGIITRLGANPEKQIDLLHFTEAMFDWESKVNHILEDSYFFWTSLKYIQKFLKEN